jgi:hypothetical protein
MLPSWDVFIGLLDIPTLLIAAAIALAAIAYAPRRARAFVIWIAQYSGFLSVVLTAAVAGRIGYARGLEMGQAQNINEMGQIYYGVAGAAFGGVLGFAAAAVAISLLFTLIDIRDNTRG